MPDTDPKPAKKAAPVKAAPARPEKQHFSGTVLKRTADGDKVMSDYVGDDEQLVRDDDEN